MRRTARPVLLWSREANCTLPRGRAMPEVQPHDVAPEFSVRPTIGGCPIWLQLPRGVSIVEFDTFAGGEKPVPAPPRR